MAAGDPAGWGRGGVLTGRALNARLLPDVPWFLSNLSAEGGGGAANSVVLLGSRAFAGGAASAS